MTPNDHPRPSRAIAHFHIASVNYLHFAALAAARAFARASAYW